MIVKGGKRVYGAKVGILMLEARFPRIPGDMGNGLTWPFPVQYKIVRGASPDLVVRRKAQGTLDQFINAAKELVDDGVDAITTNCGFLALFQQELADAVQVPVASSSLMQVPLAQAMLPPGKKVGILTISASSLTDDHLAKANCPLDTPIGTTEGGKEFTRVVLGDELELNVDLAREDNVQAARDLVSNHPELGAIVLECTNMVPYSADIQMATGLPVYSVYTLVQWLQTSLAPKTWKIDI